MTSALITGAVANSAPIAIAALFILSGAMVRTGTIEALASVTAGRSRSGSSKSRLSG